MENDSQNGNEDETVTEETDIVYTVDAQEEDVDRKGCPWDWEEIRVNQRIRYSQKGDEKRDTLERNYVYKACPNKTIPVIRYMLPTLPRSGNGWFRALWEAATGLRSGDGTGKYDVNLKSGDVGIEFKDCLPFHFTWSMDGTRDPGTGEPFLIKSHAGVKPIHHDQWSHKMILLLRNPIAQLQAAAKLQLVIPKDLDLVSAFNEEKLQKWDDHLKYWLQTYPNKTFVVFYEDLVGGDATLRERILKDVLDFSGAPYTQADIECAFKVYPPRPSHYCSPNHQHHSQSEIEGVIRQIEDKLSWAFDLLQYWEQWRSCTEEIMDDITTTTTTSTSR